MSFDRFLKVLLVLGLFVLAFAVHENAGKSPFVPLGERAVLDTRNATVYVAGDVWRKMDMQTGKLWTKDFERQ